MTTNFDSVDKFDFPTEAMTGGTALSTARRAAGEIAAAIEPKNR